MQYQVINKSIDILYNQMRNKISKPPVEYAPNKLPPIGKGGSGGRATCVAWQSFPLECCHKSRVKKLPVEIFEMEVFVNRFITQLAPLEGNIMPMLS